MAGKIDLKQVLRTHYRAGADPSLVEIGEVSFLMVDGAGDPGTSPGYAEAVGALYSTAYKVKFAEKAAGRDFVVPPLEGLWWAEDMDAYLEGNRGAWLWTMMIALPDSVEAEVFGEIVSGLREGSDPPAGLDRLRLERYAEGRSAHIMHLGPYAEEAPTIQRLHDYIADQGLRRRGKHHEIYISDPRRTAPERLKTIIRQPVG